MNEECGACEGRGIRITWEDNAIVFIEICPDCGGHGSKDQPGFPIHPDWQSVKGGESGQTARCTTALDSRRR